MMKGNRSLNLNKITRIIKDIEAGNDMLHYYPIQVKAEDNQLTILDGQHRFYICQKLKKPVHYIIVSENKSLLDIARTNSNVEKWTQQNFINCYTTAGINDYSILEQFIQAYGFSLGICLQLLSTGDPGMANGSNRKLHEQFEEGKFKIETLEKAQQFGEMAKQFESFQHWRSRDFLLALYKIIKAEKIAYDELLGFYKQNSGMLRPQKHFKEYILNLEQIVNANKKNRILIA